MRQLQSTLKQSYETIAGFLKRPKVKKRLKWTMIWLFMFGCLGFGLGYGYLSSLVKNEPVRSNQDIIKSVEDNDSNGFVYFNDRTVAGQLMSGENRLLTALAEIPQQMIDATIAIEDQSFYSHHGMDLKGTIRAVKQQLNHDQTQTGGSTITQQLSRRVFLSMDQTYERKAAEILLSMRMERVLSKDQIMLAYLTKIYFGRGSDGNNLYGVKTAAKGIFDFDDLQQLNIAQVAYLAGLPQQPIAFSAFDSQGKVVPAALDEALKRQKLVIQRMLDEHKISAEQAKSAASFDIKASLAKTKAKTSNKYPFLMVEVERRATELVLKLDYPGIKESDANYQKLWDETRNKLISKGYHIQTTIDPVIYAEMNRIAHNKDYYTANDPEKGIEQIGAVMIHNKNGAILGMIEGRDFKAEQLNHATQMIRQPGSAMKPIAAYLPALEQGLIQPASIIDDVPLVLADSGGEAHIPENWDGKYHGLITAREALKWSYNIPALKIFNHLVGIDQAWAFAKKLGITTITPQDSQAKTGVIGGLTQGVSVEELSNAYSSIANQGIYHDSYLIESIENAAGDVIYQHHAEPKTVFSKQSAYLMTDMMKSVVQAGTAADLKNYYSHYDQIPFVGKTGSTQNDADAWFVGYSPDVTVGVWAGYDQPVFKLSQANCSQKAGCGTTRAKKIWAHIMDAAIVKREELFATKAFTMPEDIVTSTVSRYSGKLPTPELQARGDVVKDLFQLQYVPTKVDDIAGMTSYTSYQGKNYRANPETPSDMVAVKFMVRRERSIADLMKEVADNLKLVPAKDRKSISHYMPIDSELDGPTAIDPRKDDGSPPIAPVGLGLQSMDDQAVLTFQLNKEPDVVGYRLYGANDGETFMLIQGKPVSSQAEAQFTVANGQQNYYMYVITAVDVAGKESGQSEIKFNDQKSIEDWFSEFFNKKGHKRK